MLSRDQLIFVLRVVGKEWLYIGEEEDLHEFISTDVGRLASELAIRYQLEYDQVTPSGKIMLKVPASVDEIRSRLQTIGLRVPNIYRSSPEETLRYFEEFGSLYLPFSSPSTRSVKTVWLPGDPRLFVNRPLMNGADVWINPYLVTHLRDLYTDFDLFRLFADALPDPKTLNNRNEIIDAIWKYHRPAGDFWVEFGSTTVHLIHQFNGQKETYSNIIAIKSIATEGQIYFKGLRLAHVGLYQVAFLFKPSYLSQIYGMEVSNDLLGLIQDIYRYFLDQIRMAEQRGEPRIRFTDQLSEFNRDLN